MCMYLVGCIVVPCSNRPRLVFRSTDPRPNSGQQKSDPHLQEGREAEEPRFIVNTSIHSTTVHIQP